MKYQELDITQKVIHKHAKKEEKKNLSHQLDTESNILRKMYMKGSMGKTLMFINIYNIYGKKKKKSFIIFNKFKMSGTCNRLAGK